METNYFGALRTIKAWLPDMRQRQSGCIVNVSSVAGRIATSPLTPYCASKFALEALSEGLAQELRPFNVRVAIVQPGIIDTAMARRIEDETADAHYPQTRRFAHMFEASLEKPTPPAIVAAKIREIIESHTETLRHPVGPDAEGFLAWRASLSDQQWVEWGALPDDAWYERVRNDFGLDAQSKRNARVAISSNAARV
jgi:NAD(P)-dependent dehydrogenase (short-subunit alcohol dehydrogenase family)